MSVLPFLSGQDSRGILSFRPLIEAFVSNAMAWELFKKGDENTRTAWGYTFQFGSGHLTTEQMHPLKYSYDVLGEECLNRLDKISPPLTAALPRNKSRSATAVDGETVIPKRDLYVLLRDHAHEDEKLAQLWKEVNTVPDWVDFDQIARGQDVFYRYGGAAITSLAFQSLLGGLGANRVVEVLARTGGFDVKVARHRLYETTQHILQVTKSLESIKPGGAGHVSSIKVRLLHAAVRRRIMTLAKERPEYYNVEQLGVPINDLDSIATVSTFSATLIWLGFRRQGIFLRKQEIIDYIALWRLVAYYLGTPTDHFETPEKAKCMMESLLLSEINPSETSKVLASNVILSLEGQPPSYASRDFLNANARWLNGNELADALGLGNPGFYYWLLAAGQTIFFMFICYTNRFIPYLDKRKIETLRRIFYAVIVENKSRGGLGGETNFDFKYIPDFHTMTTKGELLRSGIKQHGVERRNLKTLVIAVTLLGLLSWYILKASLSLMSTVMG